jgi:hypothetical protein
MSISETMVKPERRGGLHQMDDSGHRNAVCWGPSADERDEAKVIFDRYIARGWTVFRLTEDGEQGRRLTEFDPEAHSKLAIPQMVGG